jgi:hypothetical protein
LPGSSPGRHRDQDQQGGGCWPGSGKAFGLSLPSSADAGSHTKRDKQVVITVCMFGSA